MALIMKKLGTTAEIAACAAFILANNETDIEPILGPLVVKSGKKVTINFDDNKFPNLKGLD